MQHPPKRKQIKIKHNHFTFLHVLSLTPCEAERSVSALHMMTENAYEKYNGLATIDCCID